VPEWATVPEYRTALSLTGVVADELEATVAERSDSMEAVSAVLTAGLLAQMAPDPATALIGMER